MKKSLIVLLTLLLAASAASAADKITTAPRPTGLPSFVGYVPDRLIVVMKPDVGKLHMRLAANAVVHIGEPVFDKISDRFAVSSIKKQFVGAEPGPFSKTAELAKYHKIKFEAGTLEDAMEAYRNHPMVERVEPIGIHAMYATPNDFYYSYQWHLNQASDHDIDSPEAWDIEAGSDATVVAILDSGTRYYHPDLGGVNGSPSNPGAARGNMWINNAELNGSSGVDDDGNGYVDDWIGYDFIDGVSNCWPGEDCNDKDNDPRDFNGHGTHTSGIFGMLTNDDYGMCGVAGGWGNGTQAEYGNGVKIMALRMGYSYNWLGQEYGVVMMDAAAEAFYYAANNGASIASCSWGSSNSGGIGVAATYFLNSGGIIVVAAGNDGAEVSPDYLNGRGDCISVAATDENDNGASFTTYGTWVDICAPGDNIYSTYHDHYDPATNYWAAMGGTSMSAPMVAGVAALIWSQNPTWTASQVEDKLYSSAENIDAYLSPKYIGKMGAGRINAYNAVVGACDVVADFSGSPTSGCASLTVNFTDLSTGTGIDGWDWDFGDGVGTSTLQNPSYTYTSAGTYTVTLTATSSSQGCGDTEIKTDYITVNDIPTAAFTGSPTSGEVPLTVNFTNQSSGATSYLWDFGDTQTSTATNPSHTYTEAGTYTVTLTATNSCGSDDEVKIDYITVTCTPPVADFSGSPTSGEVPLTVNFTDLSTGATSWSWDFGDGIGTSTEQHPSYTYNSVDTYTVSLTVSNSCGSDIATKIDYITVIESQGPSVAYALSDIPVTGTVTGSYADTRASDNIYEVITEVEYTGHPVKRYSYLEHKWNFIVASSGGTVTFYLEAYRPANSDGDNFVFEYSTDDVTYMPLVTVASATEQIYSAALPDGTNGTVYVRVKDSNRSWGNTSLDPIYVDHTYIEYTSEPAPPVTDFVGSPTSGPNPLIVTFTDLSTGEPTTWSWDFGDGIGTSTEQNPSYTYNDIGTYTVSLTATNSYGSDTEIKTDYITVTEPGQTMHVHDIVVGRKIAGPNNSGTCTVTIYDQSNQPVSDATVYVTATGPTGGDYDDITAADGTVDFETSKVKNPSGEWCFEVTNVTHATLTYDPGSNNVTKACESGPVYKSSDPVAQLVPHEFSLHQNYPNPFNPTTEIAFALPEAAHVTLEIYNVLGQRVATLVDGFREAGTYTVNWDASSKTSGIYLYRLQAGESVETKKMLLLK